MSQSAISGRTDRKAATASRLTSLARQWTAERGLTGFTIEQLCEAAGVSRRTFFNYFPSKDEAVLGIDETDEAARFALVFIERGSRGWPAVIDDLIEMAADFSAAMDFGASDHSEFIAAVEREPRLLARALGMNRQREQQLAEMVAAREGVATGDPRVRAVIALFSSMARMAVEELLAHGGAADFRGSLTSSLAALRGVLTPSTEQKDHP